jgi:uncharacterized protein (TIGR02217 family)
MCGAHWSGWMAELPPYLAQASDQLRTGWTKRFRPALWTVDFPRPMMAAVTVPEAGRLRLDLDFLTRADLAGLIWSSEDRFSHPLLSYATDRDYRGCSLAFEWISGPGVMPLDAVNGPVLTIEGRDPQGASRSWYVRLWNYATGTPNSAQVRLDFSDLRAGFSPDGELVPMGDVDRLFLSIVPAGFDGSSGPLPQPISSHVEMRNIRASGLRSTLEIGDAHLPDHPVRVCSGYDDSYGQPPERLVEQWVALGYRGLANHYVGMSHFPALAHSGGGRFEVSGGLCGSAAAWHRALLRAAAAAGIEVILSLSFELFDANAPAAWAQRDLAGGRALTGWTPPSTLLSPCNVAAMAWLRGIAAAFAGLAAAEGQRLLFQVGEPWWWVGSGGMPCFYDQATVSRWTAEQHGPPPEMTMVAGERTAAERLWLEWLGVRLAEATGSLADAARTAAPDGFVSHLLFYAPQVLDVAAPDLRRANMPTDWSSPAWDVLQLEDYSFVTTGNEFGMARGRAAVSAQLGYPLRDQHYLAGFVLDAATARDDWPKIAAAARGALEAGVAEVFLWAWPQIARDGFTWLAASPAEEGDEDLDAFHDVRFPLELGFDAVGGPEFATQVSQLSSGFEQRNVQWTEARLSYDAGLGVRSEADLAVLLGFFRARRGRAFAFRFRDPMDWTSAEPGADPQATDQLLGVGDGARLRFRLVKRYGFAGAEEVRWITRPDPDTIIVSIDGTELAGGWTLHDGGWLEFEEPPPAGSAVRAGFAFDVPVRFGSDRIDVSLSGIRSGEVPSVPLVEVRE